MSKLSLIFIAVLTLAFTRCASNRVNTVSSLRSESPKPNKIEPEARKIFFEAEKYFFARDYDRALPLYQTIKQRHPKGKAVQLASYRMGSIHYYTGEYPQAAREFEYFVNRFPESELTFDVTYNWAATEFQLDRLERSQAILSRLKLTDIQAQGPRRAEIVFQLAAQIATNQKNFTGAIAAYASQLELPQTENSRNRTLDNIDNALNRINSKAELENLLNEVKEASTRNKINSRIAILSTTPEQVAQSPLSDTITEVSSTPKSTTLIEGSSGEKTNIGVVLPLTGKLAPYGRKALDAILLASKSFSPTRDTDFRIFVEDSKSNPTIAAQSVEKLAKENSVMGIIGPLSWKESLVAADRAQELGVINISLSSKEGISDRGAYIFQNSMTAKLQLESLVTHCIKNLGQKRFAILSPNNSFGKDMSNIFWDEVERQGGKIVAYDSYAPDEKDFQSHVQELTGLNPKYRKLEIAKWVEWQKEQKTKTGKEPKIKLPPIVDFEAIFIPDSPKTVAQIASNLAYYDVKGAVLLGTNEWNSDQLYKRGGRFVEGALFPGGINLNSQNQAQAGFVRAYTEAYGSNPDLLSGQAFEAMSILASAVKLNNSTDRNGIANFLSGSNSFNSPLGMEIAFDSHRVAKRKIPIFRLEANGLIKEE